MSQEKWFPFSKDINKNYCLFCFHHAGGTATAYRQWVSWAKHIDIYPIEIPGKGTRMREKFIDNFDELTPQLAEAIEKKRAGRDFAFYGHSMGAIMAFQTALELNKKKFKQPDKLIVAGRQAPHFPSTDGYHSSMGYDALVEELKRLNGTPKEFLENKDILKYILPSIRLDYRLNESYHYEYEMVNFPIIAHAGNADTDADGEIMKHWSEVTNSSFKIKEFSGEHFFIYKIGEEYFREIEEEVLNNESYNNLKISI